MMTFAVCFSLCLFYVRRQVRYHFYMSIITPACSYSGGLLSNIAEVVPVCSQDNYVLWSENLCMQWCGYLNYRVCVVGTSLSHLILFYAWPSVYNFLHRLPVFLATLFCYCNSLSQVYCKRSDFGCVGLLLLSILF